MARLRCYPKIRQTPCTMRTVRAPALRFHSDMSTTVGKPYDDFGIGNRARRSLARKIALAQSNAKPVFGLKLDINVLKSGAPRRTCVLEFVLE
jgi:hypothetical protein